ncbi:MAG: DNA translocase FtsK 4TM domain-containing protein [Gammaproteobacteria bacterium]|nr:DNA translocase FtsK 4TM domain-containing protein [Gammaproteobacteria bacterium]
MAQATRKKREEAAFGSQIARGLREAALWIILTVATIFLVALVSYDPSDPGFSFTGEPGPISNWAGSLGAWISDLLLFLIGYPAYLFPFLIAYGGLMIFWSAQGEDKTIDKVLVTWRITGFLLTLGAASGLASLHWQVGQGEVPVDAGGILGDFIGHGLAVVLSHLGATVLLLGLFLGGVTLFTGISWLNVMDVTGKYTLTLYEILRNRYERARQSLEDQRNRQERVELVKVKQEKTKERAKPRIEPVADKVQQSPRVERERQVPLFDPPSNTELPPLSLLDNAPEKVASFSEESLEAMSRLLELKLADFGIDVEVVAVHPGPVITRFELQPAAGVKVSQITNLAKDLARALSAISVRVVEVIPGKSVVGIEIPNETRELVSLGEILKSQEYDSSSSPVTLALGKDISGFPITADLSRMPHLLIAGTTGSGKSVAINAMVLSLLYKATPEHVRLIMIDPKMLELSVYEGIPHLLTPVVTDMKEAANALRWCVVEMERRYKLMAALTVRNISSYNRKVKEAIDKKQPIPDPLFKPEETLDGQQAEIPTLTPLPFVVVIIDELADMMIVVGKKVEELIARLAQKARASGIHLILATQRPSVDVLTGLIKANIPARIAFQVSSRVDSRTILDQIGAESLLGHGDMLYLPPGTSIPGRVHGAFVSDQEVLRVVKHLRQAGEPRYLEEILTGPSEPIPGIAGQSDIAAAGGESDVDPLYDQAVMIVTETRKASISGVQRRLKIGYNRAARMIEEMEATGIVGPLQSNGTREVLAPPPPPAD